MHQLEGIKLLDKLNRADSVRLKLPRHRSGIGLVNILRAAFLYESILCSFSLLTVCVCNFLERENPLNSCSLNAGEIYYSDQCHQHVGAKTFWANVIWH